MSFNPADYTFVAWTMVVHRLVKGRKTACGRPIPSVDKVGEIGYYREYTGLMCRNCQLPVLTNSKF